MQPNDITTNNELMKDRQNGSKSMSTETTATLCVEGWKSFNSKCYKYVPFESIINMRRTWLNAKKFCMSNMSIAPIISQSTRDFSIDLASVPDEKTNDFLKDLNQDKAWIGGYREDVMSNQWKWSDGTPMIFQSWASGEPRVDSEYMVINHRPNRNTPWGRWDDHPSNSLNNIKGFFCQYRCEF